MAIIRVIATIIATSSGALTTIIVASLESPMEPSVMIIMMMTITMTITMMRRMTTMLMMMTPFPCASPLQTRGRRIYIYIYMYIVHIYIYIDVYCTYRNQVLYGAISHRSGTLPTSPPCGSARRTPARCWSF